LGIKQSLCQKLKIQIKTFKNNNLFIFIRVFLLVFFVLISDIVNVYCASHGGVAHKACGLLFG